MSLIKWLNGEEPSAIEKFGFMIQHNFNKGAYGEYLTEYLFKNHNLGGYYKSLHNVYIPYRGKTSEIDVLLIHEKGIFVFESKNYSGWIFGSAEQQYWTQMLNKQTKNKFYNPIKQNITHINALSQYLKMNKSTMKSFIVFSERCQLKKIPISTPEYTIIKRDYVLKELQREISIRKSIFTPTDVDKITQYIKPLTNATKEVRQTHIDNINKTLNK